MASSRTSYFLNVHFACQNRCISCGNFKTKISETFGEYLFFPFLEQNSYKGDQPQPQPQHQIDRPNTTPIGPLVLSLTFKVWLWWVYLLTTSLPKWHLIKNQPALREIFKDPPILSYRKGRSLKDILVRAKLWRSTITPKYQWESCLACLFY